MAGGHTQIGAAEAMDKAGITAAAEGCIQALAIQGLHLEAFGRPAKASKLCTRNAAQPGAPVLRH